ncbi:MAG: ROK family protein, partial [Algisphaera sp.]
FMQSISQYSKSQAGQIPLQPRGTDHSQTSVHNRLLVWELLRQHGPQSRSQLRDLSSMGSSTLTYAVRDLLENNIVRPKGKRRSKTVGKKQEFVEMNPDYGWFGGFFIEGSEISILAMDAAGNPLDHRRVSYGDRFEDALDAIDHYFKQGPLGDLTHDHKPLGLGFAIPGIVDFRSGKIVQSWRLGLSDFDLAKAVKKRWGITTPVIENDVKLAAWAEAEHLGANLPDSMIFLALNAAPDTDTDTDTKIYGMGMSVIQHGQLQSGIHNSAGELDGLRSTLGKLELSAPQIQILQSPDAPLDTGIHTFGALLSHLLSILVDLIDPATVILGGSLAIQNKAFLDLLQKQVLKQRILHHCDQPHLCASAHGEQGVAMGAAMLARRNAIRNSLTSLDFKPTRR